MANDGYSGKPSTSWGKNANVKTSRLNAGGDTAWKGKRTPVKKGSKKGY